jgi:putative transposase
LAGVQAPVLQNVVGRLALAFQAVVRRVRTGETPGEPRWRGHGRYDSLPFPQVPVGGRLDAEEKRVRLANVGEVKRLLHRSRDGAPKTATISRSNTSKWYVCFACACAEPAPLPQMGQQVGVDVGVTPFATLSDGQASANPRCFRREARALAKAPSGAQRWRTVAHGGACPCAHALATGRLHAAAQPS